MFGFPTDLFGIPNNRRMNNNNNSMMPYHQTLLGNPLMIPSPFGGGMNSLIGDFGINSSPFGMMDRMMHEANQTSNTPIHSFTSTTVMSYNGTDGRPKVYQETTSRNRGPGGIEETRQAIRDSERGINKVQIGHRIGDRKHIIEREMNAQTGQISENVELENLDEAETDDFKKEWRQRSAHVGSRLRHPQHHHHHHHQIGLNRLHHPSSTSQLALEHNPSIGTSNRQHQKSYRPLVRHSDTIDLTEDTPVEEDIQEIEQVPVSVKRKASSSNDINNHRKHRQNRF